MPDTPSALFQLLKLAADCGRMWLIVVYFEGMPLAAAGTDAKIETFQTS
jgi:hypothetical protein